MRASSSKNVQAPGREKGSVASEKPLSSDAASFSSSSDLHLRGSLRLRDGDADGWRNVLALVAGGEEDVFH